MRRAVGGAPPPAKPTTNAKAKLTRGCLAVAGRDK